MTSNDLSPPGTPHHRAPRVFHSAEALKGAFEAPPRSALWITLRHQVDSAARPKPAVNQAPHRMHLRCNKIKDSERN